MPIYDFQCDSCGKVEEHVTSFQTQEIPCSSCEGTLKRQFSFGPGFVWNEDAAWIRTIIEVADKDSKKPHVVEFLKNPTRSNLKAFMKGENIRHMEPGEEVSRRRDDMNYQKMTEKLLREHKKRTALEVRSR